MNNAEFADAPVFVSCAISTLLFGTKLLFMVKDFRNGRTQKPRGFGPPVLKREDPEEFWLWTILNFSVIIGILVVVIRMAVSAY